MSTTRVGIGIDFHRLQENRDLILGGMKVPYEKGLVGHSDADVLTHALCDALLGAAALGDIGTHFPDDDAYRGICSLVLLERVIDLLARAGFKPQNVDAVIMAEAPKLGAYFPAMKQTLSPILHVPTEHIGLKATTSEGMGALGRGEGIGAMAVCLIETA